MQIGDTGRCRHCGKPIIFQDMPKGPPVWAHIGVVVYTGHWAAPVEDMG